jgi:outer membrane receptor protein involved in Fe transport
MRHITRSRLLATTIFAGAVVAAAAPAHAQTAAPQEEEDASQLEEVVVTGSRIRRDPTTSPTPLQQVSREDVLNSGQANVIDYLADIPALQNSFVPEDTTGTSLGTGGLSLVNLRGLGNARTLVLVDGRRHAGAAYFASNAVDIDTIPRLLIENVELITGGASAVYGADAVAGVVNFIQRTDIEGWEVDAAVGEINSNGELNKRLSVLWGGSAFDGRLTGYVSGEYEENEAVLDQDIRVLARNPLIYQNDLDPGSAPNDQVFDILAGYGYQTINRPRGGALTLSHNVTPSIASDPDIPAATCTTAGINANCFVYDPGFTFVFENGGIRGLDFGTSRIPAGLNRTSTRGSRDGVSLTDPINASDRLPEQEAWRFQTGGEFELTSNITAFGEFKYIDEVNRFASSTPFMNVLVSNIAAGGQSSFQGAVNNIQVGLDNAYLPAAARTLIQSNTRGGVADQRAVLRNNVTGLGFREQENTRETWRALVGVKGDFDSLFFLRDGDWEISYSRSRVADENDEPGSLDTERYMFAADAVVDTLGRVNGNPGEIVCRVRLNAANGINQRLGADVNNGVAVPRTYSPSDPAISQCRPFNIFGNDTVPQEQLGYLLFEQSRGFTMEQENALAFVSGDLWDFWGAGSIGFAAGLEYRSDSFGGYASPADRPDRVLLANVYSATPEQSYDSTEAFIELQIPLIRDLPFVQSLDVSGAYRYADYSLFGGQEVYSGQASWRVNPSLLFRATAGTSIRIPSLNELYRSPAQTFVTITDPCSRDVIDNTANATTRANRNANCAALGIPTNYFDPTPGANTPGLNGPNPLLTPEESDSVTASIVLTPESWPNFEVVLDYYDIEITQAINSVNVVTLLALCVDQAALNTAACGQITRNPTTFDITSFIQGFFNYAKQTAEGVDFSARYRQDLQELTGRDWGELNFSIRGSWNISRRSYTDALNPNFFFDLNDTQGYPTVRYLTQTTWSKGPLGITWSMDFQPSIELQDKDILITNPDSRPSYLLETGDFVQHDFTATWDVTDRIRLRGGVVNAFNEEPSIGALVGIDPFGFSAGGTVNQFDLYGRRFFVGVNARF